MNHHICSSKTVLALLYTSSKSATGMCSWLYHVRMVGIKWFHGYWFSGHQLKFVSTVKQQKSAFCYCDLYIFISTDIMQ